jgi:uncharacterized protein YndB with AHSA1/START domain
MINNSQARRRVTGTLRAEEGVGIVRMEDRYDTDIDDLWSALTEPARLARWVAQVDGDLRVGGGFYARFTSGWEGLGRVDGCQPPRSLLVILSPGEPDETVIEARLFSDGAQTRLVIEERGIPLPELALHGAGWQAHIEDLAAYLLGRECRDWNRRWQELTPTYQDLAGQLMSD